MDGKKVKNLFESSNYDTKKILNRSSKEISVELLNKLDEGVSSEFLETIGVPVFKYKTQITIHGLFPKIDTILVGGYKHIFQNKNKSIGVKYGAIDYVKKKRIYSTMKTIDGWRIQRNSTEHFVYKSSERFATLEEAVNKANEFKNDLKHIDSTLFLGGVSANIYKALWGGYFATKEVSINAIKESNIDNFLANILQLSSKEIESRIEIYEKQKLAEAKKRELEWEIAKKQREVEREQALKDLEPKFQDLKSEILNSGYSIFNGELKHGMKLIYPRKRMNYSIGVDIVCINIFEKNKELYFNTKTVEDLNEIKFAQNRIYEIKTRSVYRLNSNVELYIKK